MDYSNITSKKRGCICYLTINRPKQLNALNADTILELNKAITTADSDKNIRCIILTGAGKKAFVAGADIKEFASFNSQEGEALARKGQKLLFDLLENLGTPSIAAINGFALGGGLALRRSLLDELILERWLDFDDALLGGGLANLLALHHGLHNHRRVHPDGVHSLDHLLGGFVLGALDLGLELADLAGLFVEELHQDATGGGTFATGVLAEIHSGRVKGGIE